MTTVSGTTSLGDGSVLLAAAKAGDHDAFGRLTASHRRELAVHCYRMLGSLDDAEDAVQEAMLKAWRGLSGFRGRSSLRAWLYRIATNVCLDALDHRRRRVLPTAIAAPTDPILPPASDATEVPWLQPYPDVLLDIADPDPLADPAAAVVRREHIELAFIAAIQYLRPRQRAVLLLRDVLAWSAEETATLLSTSTASVNSALQRARATLESRLPARRQTNPSDQDADLVRKYTRAWHAADVPALMELLRADADMAMPPTPSWYHGRDAISSYLRRLFAEPWGRELRLLPTAANRQPAVAAYAPDGAVLETHTPFAIKVFTVDDGLITNINGFVDPHLFVAFGLPPTWSDG